MQNSKKIFVMNILNGLSLGIIVSLVPSALIGQLMGLLNSSFTLAKEITIITNFAMSLLPAIASFCVGTHFKLNSIQTCSIAAVAMVGSGVMQPIEAGFILKGTGDIINTGITIAICLIILNYISDKLKSYTILLVPVIILIFGGGVGLIILPKFSVKPLALAMGI